MIISHRYKESSEEQCYVERKEKIIENFSSFNQEIGEQKLTIMHINIRSLNKNFDELCLNLNALRHKPSILICTETWTLQNTACYIMEDYDLHYTKGNLTGADGVVVYVSKHLKANTSQINTINIGLIKAIEIKLKLLDTDLLITAIYRVHVIKKDDFIDDLNNYLMKLTKEKNHVILGDLNINLLDDDIDTEIYKNNLIEKGYISYINTITRQMSGTCIDHIFAKLTLKNVNTFIIKSGITDHYTTAIQFNVLSWNAQENSTYEYINFNKLKKISKDKVHWDEIQSYDDVNVCTTNLVSQIKKLIEKSTMKKKNKAKKLAPRHAWITTGLAKSCSIKEKMYNKWSSNKTDMKLKRDYDNYKNKLQHLIKVAKNKYIQENILNKDLKGKAANKNLWKFVNDYARNDKVDKQGNFELSVNGKVIKDDTDIANNFNKFFSTIGQKLGSSLSTLTHEADTETETESVKSIFLNPTTPKEILEIINRMDSKKAGGIDGFTTKILQLIANEISGPLAHIINISIQKGICPNHFKKAEIIPIYKKGDKADMTNYRPISLISNLAKVFEKVIHSRLSSYLESNNLLSPNQYGFRPGKSTKDAIAELATYIYGNLDKSKPIIAVFIDLAKAFDTVDHELLLTKLCNIGIRGNALMLIKSYLSNRSQVVRINNKYSKEEQIKSGVPQGSILGPLLFTIFINSMLQNNVYGRVIAYADDTVLLVTADTWNEALAYANSFLNSIVDWLRRNKLCINIDKTEYMTFSTYVDRQPEEATVRIHKIDCRSNPNCDCDKISRVHKVKYLGIYIDYLMRWEEHVSYITSKNRYLLFIIRKLNNVLNEKQLIILYHALFISTVNYGIIAWGSANVTILKKLQVLQNHILRLIYRKPLRYSTIALYEDSQLMNIHGIYCFNSLMYMYNELKNKFVNSNKSTRFKSIALEKYKLEIGKKCYKYTAITLFNSLEQSFVTQKKRDLCTVNLKQLNISIRSNKKLLQRWILKNVL